MYKIIESSSFIDIAIDPDVDNQFYTGRTTGALLLAYGLGKPCILERRYAKAYRISETESVVYGNGEFGMAKGLMMNDLKYKEMVNCFEEKAAIVKNNSIKNIRDTIGPNVQ